MKFNNQYDENDVSLNFDMATLHLYNKNFDWQDLGLVNLEQMLALRKS